MRYIIILLALLSFLLTSCSSNPAPLKYETIFEAIRAGDVKEVKMEIKKNPSLLEKIDIKSDYKGTPLFEALVCTQYHKSKDALNKKIHTNVDPKLYFEIVDFLINAGSNVNFKNEIGESPLYITAAYGEKEVALKLIEKGADINSQCRAGWTPLHQAAMKGKPEVASLLTTHGADVNKTDSEGHTPLHSAAGYGHIDIVKLLVEKGADVNKKDITKMAAIDYAYINNHKDVIEYLTTKGAKSTLQKKELEKLRNQKPRS